jgi:hypothetical protein
MVEPCLAETTRPAEQIRSQQSLQRPDQVDQLILGGAGQLVGLEPEKRAQTSLTPYPRDAASAQPLLSGRTGSAGVGTARRSLRDVPAPPKRVPLLRPDGQSYPGLGRPVAGTARQVLTVVELPTGEAGLLESGPVSSASKAGDRRSDRTVAREEG